MLRIAVVFAALIASACSVQASRCDDEIKSGLVAPSTYKRISAETEKVYGGQIVTIEYDAENALGVPIRDRHQCTFSD